jgi:hypothetical protein
MHLINAPKALNPARSADPNRFFHTRKSHSLFNPALAGAGAVL